MHAAASHSLHRAAAQTHHRALEALSARSLLKDTPDCSSPDAKTACARHAVDSLAGSAETPLLSLVVPTDVGL